MVWIQKKLSMHHYNFPQYSVGETGRCGAPGIVTCSERALARVFRYIPIRYPSGSSGIKCSSSSLYLNGGATEASKVWLPWDLSDGNNYTKLDRYLLVWKITLEHGLKVAGTAGLASDIKIQGILYKLWQKPWPPAKKARFEILDVISKILIPVVRPPGLQLHHQDRWGISRLSSYKGGETTRLSRHVDIDEEGNSHSSLRSRCY